MEKKKQNENEKKRKSIINQVTMPLTLFLTILMIIDGFFLYIFNISYYIVQRQETAAREAVYTANCFMEFKTIGWLSEYWQEHYDEMELVYDLPDIIRKETEINSLMEDYQTVWDTEEETVENASPEAQRVFAELAYARICETLTRIKIDFNPFYLYSFTIKNNDEMFFMATGAFENEKRVSQGGELFELGVSTPYVEGVYPVLDEIVKTGKFVENIETSLSPGADNSLVHMFAPVYDEDGEVALYVGVALPWKDLIVSSLRITIIFCVITLIFFILIGFYISGLLIKKVTGPVGVEKLALSRYKVYKDPEKLKENLSDVQSNNEIEELAVDFSEMADELDRYIIENQKATVDKERMKAELSMAKTIQESRLPSKFPAFPDRKDFDIYASMTPTKEVAGDFYDFFMVDDDHIALVIADVSGKGISASLFMMLSKAIIRCRLLGGESPAEALDMSNAQIMQGNDSNMFVTVWVAVLDLRTGKGLAANAGHEHPALRRKDGKFELVKYRHSPAIGVMDGIPYAEHEFTLEPGDTLFVYTDGVPEATNINSELFGEEKLLVALNRDPDAAPEVIDRNVKKSIDMFVDEAEQFDDITMLTFKYFGPQKEE